jgi:hypothetical protein
VKPGKVPAEHVTVVLLATKPPPVSQATVQAAPWAMFPPPPQAPDDAASVTSVEEGSVHAFAVQVKASKTPAVVAPQTGEALAVYPLSQTAPQVAPAASEVTPAPQAPVATAFATLVGTTHAAVELWQVKVGSVVESLGHAGMAMLGVKPVSQVAVQVSPSAIEVTPAPQNPVEAPLASVEGTAHAELCRWHVKGSKTPSEHSTVSLLGTWPVTQDPVQDAPWSIEDTPGPQCPHTAALATPVGTAHGPGGAGAGVVAGAGALGEQAQVSAVAMA